MDKGVIPEGNERELPSPLSRFKQWIILSISEPDNFPVYLTALFTFLLASFTFFVAVFAYYAWTEAQKGTHAIEGQLAIMRMEQAPFVWPRDNFPMPAYDDKSQQVIWNWNYNNYGKGVAYNVQTRSYIKIGDELYQPSHGALEKREGVPMPPGGGRLATAVSRPGISKEYFEKMIKTDEKIGLLVELTYSSDPAGKDMTTQAVCSEILASDATMYREPEHCQKK